MKVLVTGANGYIGKGVVKALLEKNAQVIAVDQRFDDPDSRAENIVFDIFSEKEDMYSFLGKPDVCIHLAWRDGFVHNADTHMGCLSSHYNFLRTMLNGGLKHIAVMGSMHEVGYWEGAIDENTPCNPLSLYGIAKDALRRALFQMTNPEETVVQWLRGFYIYSNNEKSPSIFGKIIAADQRGDEWFPLTSGKNKYDFLSLDELCDQVASCAMQTQVTGIINCCSGKPVPLAEEIEWFVKKNGLKIQLKLGAYPDRPYDSPAVWGDASKIQEIMNNQKQRRM